MLAPTLTARCRGLLIAWLIAGTVVLVAGMSAPARAADVDRVPGGACREVYAFLQADAAILRGEGEIPARWEIRIDGDGKATAFITTLHCDITVDGRRRPVVYTTLSALLDSSALPAPERERATSNIFGLPLDFYLFTWSSNDAGFARWLRAGTGLQDHVVQAPGLAYRMGAGPLHDYAFTAPAPVPSPFSLTESVSDAVFGPATGVVNFWRETAAGTVMIETTANAASLGTFDKLTLTAAPGSPLARILGNGGIQQRTCSAARLLSPLSGAVAGRAESGCFAHSAMQSARWRKDIPPGGETAAATCSSRRMFRIHLPRAWRSATVSLDGRALRVVRHRRRLSAIVDLRRRPPGTVRLRAVGRTSAGRRVAQTRVYRLCAQHKD